MLAAQLVIYINIDNCINICIKNVKYKGYDTTVNETEKEYMYCFSASIFRYFSSTTFR